MNIWCFDIHEASKSNILELDFDEYGPFSHECFNMYFTSYFVTLESKFWKIVQDNPSPVNVITLLVLTDSIHTKSTYYFNKYSNFVDA